MVEKNWKELDRLPNHSTRGLCLSGCCIDNFLFFIFLICNKRCTYKAKEKGTHDVWNGLKKWSSYKREHKKKKFPLSLFHRASS